MVTYPEEDSFEFVLNGITLRFNLGLNLNDYEIYEGNKSDKDKFIELITGKCLDKDSIKFLLKCDEMELIQLGNKYVSEDDDIKLIYDLTNSEDNFFKRFAMSIKKYSDEHIENISMNFGVIHNVYKNPAMEAMKSIVQLNKTIIDSIKPFTSSLSIISNSAAGGISKFQKDIQSNYASLSSVLSYNSIIDFKTMFAPVIEMQERMKNLGLTQSYLNNIYKTSMIGIKNNPNLFKITQSTLDLIQEYSDTIDTHDVKVNSDGSVTADGEVLNVNEVKQIVSEALQGNWFLNRFNSIEGMLKKIVSFLGTKNGNIIVTILLSLLCNFISTHGIDPAYEMAKNSISITHKSQDIKTIKNYFSTNYKEVSDFIKDYRIVVRDELEIREYDNRSSKILSVLMFSSIVKVIKSKNDWTLVEWVADDSGEVTIKGWVFTRYLKKIN